jgi:hypothetical protein
LTRNGTRVHHRPRTGSSSSFMGCSRRHA